MSTGTSIAADRRYLARASLLSIVGLAAKVVSPALTIVLARLFTQAEFGLYVSLELFAYSLSQLVLLGLDKGLVWFVPQNLKLGREPHHGVGAAILRAHLHAAAAVVVAAVFVALGGLGLFATLRHADPWFVLLCLFATIPLVGLACSAAALEGLRHPEYKIFVTQFLAMSLSPILAMAFRSAGMGEMSLPWGLVVGSSIGVVVMIVPVRRHFPGLRLGELRVPRELLRFALPLGISDTIAGVLLRVDLWMILLLMGPRAAAVYGVMVMLSNGVKAIRQTFDPLIVPVVARMSAAEQGAGLRQVHSYAVNVVTSLQLVAAWGVLFFSRELMSIAGRQYAIEPQALSILLAGNLVNGFLGLNGQILVGLGRSRIPLLANVVAIAVNVVANLALIPRLGLVGAALGTNIAYLVQCGIVWQVQRRLTGIQVYERHLAANGVLIVLFGCAVFALQDTVLACSVVLRSLGFAAVLAVMGILFFLKRGTFSARIA